MKKVTWKDRKFELEAKLADGWTYPEIALHYDVTIGTIKSAVYRLKLSRTKARQGEGVSESVSGNTLEVASKKGLRIRTLDQLLASCHVDLDEWAIERHVVNTWENFSVAYGHQTLYQVKAWLVRKEPIAIKPVISPVSVVISPDETYNVSVDGDAESVLVIADPHIGYEKSLRTAQLTPFHDRMVLDLAVSIAGLNQPNYIVILGDFFDLADWTDHFTRAPQFWWTTQPALEEAAWWLGRLRDAAPDASIVLFEGNHEKRLYDKIAKANPESYGIRKVTALDDYPVMTIPYLLDLDSMDIQWVGEYPRGYIEIGECRFSHGVKHDSKSGGTVRKVLDDTFKSQVVGHSHSFEIAWKRIPDDTRYLFAASCGCACHIDGRVPGSTTVSNWIQGLLLLNEIDTGYLVPSPIVVEEGVAYCGLEHFKSQKESVIVSQLKEATNNRWNY